MILVIKKRAAAAAIVSVCFFWGLGALLWAGSRSTVPAFSAADSSQPVTVVVDAGHGGEDGGAVAADGTVESGLNLEVALRLEQLLRFNGQPTVMTRVDGNAIHTEGGTIRARKASDIRNRTDLVNGTENGILLSIHQNSLPSSPSTRGAQVFWNGQTGADSLAQVIQDSLNTSLNIGWEKQAKKIPQTVYLMNHVERPAVLVECGFLTNAEEFSLLKEPTYQTKLAAAIAAGTLRALAGEEVPE